MLPVDEIGYARGLYARCSSLDQLLDTALAETFPASDPMSTNVLEWA